MNKVEKRTINFSHDSNVNKSQSPAPAPKDTIPVVQKFNCNDCTISFQRDIDYNQHFLNFHSDIQLIENETSNVKANQDMLLNSEERSKTYTGNVFKIPTCISKRKRSRKEVKTITNEKKVVRLITIFTIENERQVSPIMAM